MPDAADPLPPNVVPEGLPGPRQRVPRQGQVQLLRTISEHEGITISGLLPFVQPSITLAALSQRLKILGKDGFVQLKDATINQHTARRVYLSVCAFELIGRPFIPFPIDLMLPELGWKHDHRRENSEDYTAAMAVYNERLLYRLGFDGETYDLLATLLDQCGLGLDAFYDGAEAAAAILLDSLRWSLLPRVVAHFAWMKHRIRFLSMATGAAHRLLAPGPDSPPLSMEELHALRDEYLAVVEHIKQEAAEIGPLLQQVPKELYEEHLRDRVERTEEWRKQRVEDLESEATYWAGKERIFQAERAVRDAQLTRWEEERNG